MKHTGQRPAGGPADILRTECFFRRDIRWVEDDDSHPGRMLRGSWPDPGRKLLAHGFSPFRQQLFGGQGGGLGWFFSLERGLGVSPLACVNSSKPDVTQYTSLVTVL